MMLARFLRLTPHSDDFVVRVAPTGAGMVDIFVMFKASDKDAFAARTRVVGGAVGLSNPAAAADKPEIVSPMVATPFAPTLYRARKTVAVTRDAPATRGRIEVEILNSQGAAVARKWCAI